MTTTPPEDVRGLRQRIADAEPKPKPRCTCHLHDIAASGGWGSIYPPPRCPIHTERPR